MLDISKLKVERDVHVPHKFGNTLYQLESDILFFCFSILGTVSHLTRIATRIMTAIRDDQVMPDVIKLKTVQRFHCPRPFCIMHT